MTTKLLESHARAATAAVVSGALAGSALLALSVPAAAAPAAPAAPASTAALPATAVGRLTPSGCVGSGMVSCDLYAMTGTTQVLGRSIPIWGFSSSDVAGSATAPGPVLTVAQGSQVTITVHNQLTEPVSLALRGQSGSDLASSAGDDTAGAAAGGTKSYTFSANRAGTFMYEAGHTSDGARQVAMGLAGALVVLPSDNSGTAYGGPSGTGYDDDGLLVLSEIDPALNANPAGFDMRDFKPKYRLINGLPFPSSNPIATDQGHRVLLRYVNVGAQTHAMSVLGLVQHEVAQDGHPLTYPQDVTAQNIDPGMTMDAIVTMPTGPEAKLAVYEAGGHLDNNSQHTSDPTQLAFGGMLTYLDTNAPAPSTDVVGPVSMHIAASPNPSDGKSPVTVTADLSDATTGSHAVSQAEFVVDDAMSTGVGYGVPMTAQYGTVDVAGAIGTIPVSPAGGSCTADPSGAVPVALECLDAGKHSVYVRAEDDQGNWGVVGSVILNLPKTGPQTTGGSASPAPANGSVDVALSATGDDSAAAGTITAAEYFVDAAGAGGTGTALQLNRSATVVAETGTIPAATVKDLGEGMHHVLVHSRDSLGLWGPTLDVPLYVDLTGPTVDAASVGPNPTNGKVGDASNPTSLVISAQITDRDSNSSGGQGALQSNLTSAEAFIDSTSGAPGSGLQLIPVDGKYDSPSEAAYGLIPLSQVYGMAEGTHHIYVRGKDAAGNWGTFYGADLLVDRTAPALSALAVTPNPTNGASSVTATAALTERNTLATAEVWFGATDPGIGKGTKVPVSVVNGQVVLTVPVAAVAPTTAQQVSTQLHVRVKDLAGNWSNTVASALTVTRLNSIFSSTFQTSGLTDWSARTGGVSLSSAAAMTQLEPSSTFGLRVALPTSGTKNSFVTDNRPLTESAYHARFAFNANTLTPGNGPVTLFDARNATASVVSLRMTRSGTSNQLSTTLNTGTTTATSGTPFTLAPGAHTIQLDWSALTGLTVRVDSAVVSGLTVASATTLRVETARLGVIPTVTGSTASGIAYFDTFTSTRFSLP